METPKQTMPSVRDLDSRIKEYCTPFAQIHDEKSSSSQFSKDEIIEANQLVLNELSNPKPSHDGSYTPEECAGTISHKLKETTQKLCNCDKVDLIIQNYAVSKLRLKPYSSIEKITDWEFRFFSTNDHWILKDTTEGKRYHIKTALKILHHLRGSFLNEIFMYKILEYLGFGPKAEAVFIPEFKSLYTITHDLNNEDRKFVTAQLQKAFECQDEKSQVDLLAVNFLVDFFELDDVYGRETNYGIIKTRNQKTRSFTKKPAIIDFHLRINQQCLSNDKIIQKYVFKLPKQERFLLGLTLSQINQDNLKKLVKSLDEGSPEDDQIPVQFAIEAAFQYTKEIHQEINLNIFRDDKPFEVAKYSMEPVEKLGEYYLGKWKQFKLEFVSQLLEPIHVITSD